MRDSINAEQLESFRSLVRLFCADKLPADLRRKAQQRILEKADYVRWQKILHQHGWTGGHWPVQYGGQGWSSPQRSIFDEETARAGAPPLFPFGLALIGPVIYTFGTRDQKDRFLPGILSGDTWWCQGYSEPGAGSDLASVATGAQRHGDHYIVNGQKTWTTTAHWADMMFALVRTSSEGKPREGLSLLLIDMKSEGVRVRPIVGIDLRHELNDVFFDNVRVPVGNLVGEERLGWTYANVLLNNERIGAAEIGKAKRRLDALQLLIDEKFASVGLAGDRVRWRRRVAELSVRLLGLESLCLEMMAPDGPRGDARVQASVVKILGSELGQALTSALLSIAARDGLTFCADPARHDPLAGVVEEHLHERATSIFSGANEIQRNIIARSVLSS
jgi:alkylation response protein AidB-like acyl-CoA dehydrogenase